MADERDPKVSQHYRQLESLEPPRELDRRILDMARDTAREAELPHAPLVAPAGRHRWYYSLAAAAVLVFAVALTLHLERERPDPEAEASGTPLRLERELRGQIKPAQAPEAKPANKPAGRAPVAEERATPPSFTPDPQERMPGGQAAASAAATEAQATAEKRLREADAKQRAARSTAAAPAAAPPPQRQDAGALAQQSVDVLASRREAAAQRLAAPAPAAAQVAAAPENPERWLERIAELRSRGRHVDADRELAAFRKAYPDYRLSDLMRERVEGTPTPGR